MHSRIFQVSLDPFCDEKDYIAKDTYYDHWFVGEIADYVDDSNREKDIEWLKDVAKGYHVDADESGVFLVVTSKEEYFATAFKRFKTAIESIRDCTLKDFADGFKEIWEIKDSYEDKFDFWIDADGEMMPFDRFIRLCAKDEKYYIGGTVDYHF